jgi:DNA-binding NarL/FixJ family response regulator
VTRRERTLIVLVRRGLSNREIAAELGLAEQTVKNYMVVLCEKLHVRNRTQLALLDASTLTATESRKK